MKTVLFLFALVVGTSVAIFAVTRIIRIIINLVVYLRSKRRMDYHIRSCNVVFNRKTGKIEPDNSIVLPFND